MTLASPFSFAVAPSRWAQRLAVILAVLALGGVSGLIFVLEGPAIMTDFTTDD